MISCCSRSTGFHLKGACCRALRLSAIRSHRLKPAEQIRDLILACEPQWMGKGIEIDASLDAVEATADEDLMSQVWMNLLSNSIKFTPQGGLIEVRLERLENKALLIVSDTGQGIDPEFLPHIFDRFSQIDTTSKRRQG